MKKQCLTIMLIILAFSCHLLAGTQGGEERGGLRGLLPEKLVDANGQEVALETLEGKLIGLYFSAEWCPPCRQFTPHLVRFRNQHQEQFEVVFVSSDRSADAQQQYMQNYRMNWPALPFGAEERGALARKYEVRGIPALIILDSQGNLITKNGRGDVSGNRQAIRDWQARAEKLQGL